jgi:serine/threonine protein kinase
MVVDLRNFKLDKNSKLGEGGQAIVYKLNNQTAGKIYKKPQEVNIVALTEMVNFLKSLNTLERQRFENETSWPIDVVQESTVTVGITMSLAPNDYFVSRSSKNNEKVLLTFNNLVMPLLPAHKFVPQMNSYDRITILQSLLSLVNLLHSHFYILGDISGKNIAWSPITKKVFLMDCDSARMVGKASALPQMHTIQFEDPDPMPHLIHQSSLDTDNYRIGLLIVGVLTQHFPLQPGKALPKNAQRELDNVADFVNNPKLKIEIRRLWNQLGLGAGLRPNPLEWAAALTQ